MRAKKPARCRTPWAVPSTPSRALAPAVQEIADGDERRSARYLLPTSDVDRQLRGLVQLLRECDRRDFAGQHPGPLEGDQTMPPDCDDFVEQVLDAWPGVNRDGDEREILGQREEPVGAAVVL